MKPLDTYSHHGVQVQKDALDKRFTVRQTSESGNGAVSAEMSVSQGHRGRKIAPTKIVQASGENALAYIAPLGNTFHGSVETFVSPSPGLMTEASARDLCSSSIEAGGSKCVSVPVSQLAQHPNMLTRTVLHRL